MRVAYDFGLYSDHAESADTTTSVREGAGVLLTLTGGHARFLLEAQGTSTSGVRARGVHPVLSEAAGVRSLVDRRDAAEVSLDSSSLAACCTLATAKWGGQTCNTVDTRFSLPCCGKC